MTSPRPEDTRAPHSADPEAEGTGVPGLVTWRAVYTCLFAGLVVYIILLAVITRVYAP